VQHKWRRQTGYLRFTWKMADKVSGLNMVVMLSNQKIIAIFVLHIWLLFLLLNVFLKLLISVLW